MYLQDLILIIKGINTFQGTHTNNLILLGGGCNLREGGILKTSRPRHLLGISDHLWGTTTETSLLFCLDMLLVQMKMKILEPIH